ncbi:hypothetical protein GCM10009789_38710 [Kribbella sancticallisti]|uniref:Uncharacterized protein n=1 Tax=Kribbella sancticallisti TaxID=460087 RepID=A0ABN2DN04_9ACTN
MTVEDSHGIEDDKVLRHSRDPFHRLTYHDHLSSSTSTSGCWPTRWDVAGPTLQLRATDDPAEAREWLAASKASGIEGLIARARRPGTNQAAATGPRSVL